MFVCNFDHYYFHVVFWEASFLIKERACGIPFAKLTQGERELTAEPWEKRYVLCMQNHFIAHFSPNQYHPSIGGHGIIVYFCIGSANACTRQRSGVLTLMGSFIWEDFSVLQCTGRDDGIIWLMVSSQDSQSKGLELGLPRALLEAAHTQVMHTPETNSKPTILGN